jgi:CRP/FNR family cyclic AMP-dependent transcriptional regulator
MMTASISMSDEARCLSLIPLFEQLDAIELEKLAEKIEQVSFNAGEAIFHDHDQGDALYVVESGAVRIWVRDEDVRQVTLSELTAGDFFGELALLDVKERSANATALVDSTLHRLHRDDFYQFMLEHPASAVLLIRALSARLRQTNTLVSSRVARNINQKMEEHLTLGERVANHVASFGGSWPFIIIYCSLLLVWIAVNTFFLARYSSREAGAQFDPYPYILLNLMLSMTASLQAPVILMAQKRVSARDRIAAEQDFKVNLKSELMLDELARGDGERSAKMDKLISAAQSLQNGVAAPGNGL